LGHHREFSLGGYGLVVNQGGTLGDAPKFLEPLGDRTGKVFIVSTL
jgi:hypothetical protein